LRDLRSEGHDGPRAAGCGGGLSSRIRARALRTWRPIRSSAPRRGGHGAVGPLGPAQPPMDREAGLR
jgi:hypothetical protein